MLGRAKKWSMVGLLGGAVFMLGCPLKPDVQELKPLSKTHEAESTDTRKPEAAPSAGDAPATDEETAAGTNTGAWNGGASTAFSTGDPNWQNSTGRKSGSDVTFGPGLAGAAQSPRWAFNTDSTGGVGQSLGFGVTYGASTGKVDVVPGTPATRPDNWPTVQTGAAPKAQSNGKKPTTAAH